MKNFAKGTIKVVCCVAITAFLLTLAAPKAVHALVSTLVTVSNTTANPVPTQQALPGKPFFGNLEPDPNVGGSITAGPGTSGTLAVTNITISNLGGATQEVVISNPIFINGLTCGDQSFSNATTPYMQLLVPAAQTISISYPTPLVFPPTNGGISCVAAQNFSSGPIEVYVTGFVQ